jgi:EpsI family protein
MSRFAQWMPAVILATGALFTVGIDTQRTLPLRGALAEAVPASLAGAFGENVPLSDDEVRVAGVTMYLMREYHAGPDADGSFSVYVGYYDRQTGGRTIHSPKNCLPGAGWEALASEELQIPTPTGGVPVNRYVLQKGAEQALVLYWYQGRGRVQANEYRVKWDLLRDAATRQRSDEALVRIVVPIAGHPDAASATATRVAQELIPRLDGVLPS